MKTPGQKNTFFLRSSAFPQSPGRMFWFDNGLDDVTNSKVTHSPINTSDSHIVLIPIPLLTQKLKSDIELQPSLYLIQYRRICPHVRPAQVTEPSVSNQASPSAVPNPKQLRSQTPLRSVNQRRKCTRCAQGGWVWNWVFYSILPSPDSFQQSGRWCLRVVLGIFKNYSLIWSRGLVARPMQLKSEVEMRLRVSTFASPQF